MKIEKSYWGEMTRNLANNVGSSGFLPSRIIAHEKLSQLLTPKGSFEDAHITQQKKPPKVTFNDYVDTFFSPFWPPTSLPLKCGFCNKSFRKDEPLTSWTPFQHIGHHLWVGLLLVTATSSGILKAKQKLGRTFNSDKLGGIAFTKISKLTMCSA